MSSRRECLRGILGTALYAPLDAAVSRAEEQVTPPRSMGTPGVEKKAVSSSLEAAAEGITPVDQFFVRSHFNEPKLAMASWKLRIEGLVANALELTFSDLLQAPVSKVEALLECAGNERLLVSNGIWEGTPLTYLLHQAGLRTDAFQVMFEGADEGKLLAASPISPFARLVPLSKCLEKETLLAYKLNGQFLAPRSGFPARTILPGWYAMDSVKWMRRIVVLGRDDRPDAVYKTGMDSLYRRILQVRAETRMSTPVTRMLLRSNIAHPSPEAKLGAGLQRVWGFAWGGDAQVAGVELSTDGGAQWQPARLEGPPKRFTWVKWNYEWQAQPGQYTLVTRARDSAGNVQPTARDPQRLDGYELNAHGSVTTVVK